MYTYRVGWSSHEESEDMVFHHERQYSQEEINQIVENALFHVISTARNGLDSYAGNGRDSWRVEVLMSSNEFVDFLLSQGFVEQKYEVEVSLWGWNRVGRKVSREWQGETPQWEKQMIERLEERIKTEK